MKKIRVTALLVLICVMCSACSSRKAIKQLDTCEYLYADGTALRDGSGEIIRLQSKSFVISRDEPLQQTQLETCLADQNCNSIVLELKGDLIDDSQTPWKFSGDAQNSLRTVLDACSGAQKYLMLGISEYPQEYNAWYEDSDFEENITSLWCDLADLLKEEAYFGAYMLHGFPRPGVAEGTSSLTFYEQMLQRICDQMRQIDSDHLICVGTMSPYSVGEDQYHAFPYIKDHNFMYSTSLEALSFYSDQAKIGDDGTAHLTYPNSFWHNVDGYTAQQEIMGSNVDFSDTDYQTRATSVFKVEQEGLFARIGANVIPENENGGGELRVWSARFAECDADGKEIKVLYNMDTSVDIPFMCDGISSTPYQGSVYETDGSAYLESVYESTFFYIKDLNIPVEKDKYYQLTLTMKQRGMTKSYDCAPYVQLCSTPQSNQLDRAYVEQCCSELYHEAKEVGVPVLFMDVGVSEAAREKGGDLFVQDLLHIIDSYEQSYSLK